jgi:porin
LGKLPGGYRFGLWYDPQPKPQFFNDLGDRRRTVPMKSDDMGFYFNMDQMLFKEKPKDDADTQGLGLFFRYGYAPQDVNEVEHFWSIGAQYQGLIPTRDDDVLGFGFAQGRISGTAEDLGGGDQESVYELYYNIKVFPWLHVSPDCQYIVNPGAVGGQQDAFIIGLRILATF